MNFSNIGRKREKNNNEHNLKMNEQNGENQEREIQFNAIQIVSLIMIM